MASRFVLSIVYVTVLRWDCVNISSGKLIKIGKNKVDSSEGQSNLLFVFSWEAIKITSKLIRPPHRRKNGLQLL